MKIRQATVSDVPVLQREADARGVNSIEVDVWAFNDEAREVFVKLGFRRVMERLTLSAETPRLLQ
jgi:hypothetical protein